MNKKPRLTLELNLRVTYILNGVSQLELRTRLEKLVEIGMGDGLLTGDTPAEVETHNFSTKDIPQPVKEKKPKGRFHEGVIHVCAHRVSFFYRLPPKKRISTDDLSRMTMGAEERAQECISQGYVEGELNYQTEKFQATGWWTIEKT